MKSTAHFACIANYTMDDFFNSFWNNEEIYSKDFKQKPEEFFKKYHIDSYEKETCRVYAVHVHFKGTFSFLLEPYQSRVEEELDGEFDATLRKGFDEKLECSVDWGYYSCNMLDLAKEGVYYKEGEPIEIDEHAFESLLVDGLPEISKTSSSKICREGKKYSGVFTVKTIRVYDQLKCRMYYTGGRHSSIIFSFPYDMPGTVTPKPCYRFFGTNEKKDQKVMSAFKEEFIKKCNEDITTKPDNVKQKISS